VERIKAKWAEEEAAAATATGKSSESEILLTNESALAKIMGVGAKGVDEDNDSDEDSSDDDRDPNDDTGLFGQTASEMMMNAFQLLSKRVQRDQAKSLQIDEANFKLRVADLLEVWIKRNVDSTLVPTVLLLPLCQAIVKLTAKTQKSLDAASLSSSSSSSSSSRDVTLLELESALLGRLKQIVTKRILGKGKDYPRGPTAAAHVSNGSSAGGLEGFCDETMATLEACVELATTAGRNPETTQLATSAIVYCCRVLRGTTKQGEKNSDQHDWGLLNEKKLTEILSEKVLKDYLQRKSTRITEDFVSRLLTRAPLACSGLVPSLTCAIQQTTIDVTVEKERQIAKAKRAEIAERKRQEARERKRDGSTQVTKKVEATAEDESASAASTLASKKRKRDDEDSSGNSEWKCRSQFHRAASARLAVAALRSGAAREHSGDLVTALCSSVSDVERARVAGVKVRADVVKSLVELSSALSSHGKLTEINVSLSALSESLVTLVNVVKTAAGIKQRGQLQKMIQKTTNRVQQMVGDSTSDNAKSAGGSKKSAKKKSKKKLKKK
jgi:hypothetical protein